MKTLNRRQLLRGLGGASLALPILPSLLTRKAHAQAMSQPRRFVALTTPHGGIWARNMYPGDHLLTEQQSYAGHPIRAGRLEAEVSGGMARLSPVLQAPSGVLTEAMVGQFNVLRGLDAPYYLAHHRGGHLGNFADNDRNGTDGATVSAHPRPTIDQVMAWSPSFYSDLSTNRMRSIVVGQQGISWGWSRPSARSGHIQPVPPVEDNMVLFNRLFRPGMDPGTPSPLVVDQVRAAYTQFQTTHRNRLGAGDRRRLTEHMDRLFEIERRLRAEVSCPVTPPGIAGDYVTDGNAAQQLRFWQGHNDVISLALACGVSQVAVIGAYGTFSDFEGDWHQDVAHQCLTPERQPLLVDSHQRFFEHVFLDLASKLAAMETPNGGTVLDQTLMAWSQESGLMTHDSMNIPVITCGGAGGAFKTGWSVDYRDRSLAWDIADADDPGGLEEPNRPGLYWNQWLGTALEAVGVPREEFAEYSQDISGDYGAEPPGGYGVVYASDHFRAAYAQAWARLGDPLPFVT